MSVLENVKVAFHCRQEAGVASAVLRTPVHAREEERVERESHELLKIFSLDGLAAEKAKNLPYGSQRRLEIARAMATSPRLLLLDEPAAGMNPQEATQLMDLIRWVRDRFGMAILLVEHNMKVVMGICETVHVLDYGSTIAIGQARRDPAQSEGDRSLPGWRLTLPSGTLATHPVLEVRDLRVSYGAIEALKGVSLMLGEGEIVTLIGANGAGKSTTLRAIMGLVARPVRRGRVPGASHAQPPDVPSRARRPRPRPRRARDLREPLRAREPRDGRLRAARRPGFLRHGAGVPGVSAAEGARQADRRHAFRAESSRCSRSGAPSCPVRRCCCSTSRRSVSRRSSCTRSSKPSRRFTGRARPSCSSSRTRTPRCKHSNRAYVLETGSVALEGTSEEVAANPRVKEAYLGE